MGVNSLPKIVTLQRRDCDLNPGTSAAESSMPTTRLPSHSADRAVVKNSGKIGNDSVPKTTIGHFGGDLHSQSLD